MKIKLNIHTFPDTMNPGSWIGTVTTKINEQEHGFFTEGALSENEALDQVSQHLGEFIRKVVI